jgi:nicotinamidase-related amidase
MRIKEGNPMQIKSLVVIDIQNDITKNYKEIIDNVNRSIDWAVENEIHVVYIRHYNLSDGTRTFKPNTRGSELVSDMKLVSKRILHYRSRRHCLREINRI